MRPLTDTYFEIDTDAIMHNYRYIRGLLRPGTKFLAVIKAFAYGHEDVITAKLLEKNGVDYFAVAYLPEGIRLRKAGIRAPVMVLHPQNRGIQEYLKYALEPVLYNRKILEIYAPAFRQSNVPVHLKFNTGLNRLGFGIEDIPDIFKVIDRYPVRIASVFSHLVASEDPAEKEFSLRQIGQYDSLVSAIRQYYPDDFIRHLCNTSGVFNYPQAHYDMVRVGIGLYGYANNAEYTQHLKSAGRLVSVISQIHSVQPGESVGYNRGFLARKTVRSATVPIGHADGIPRSWGMGKAYFRIHGKKAPVLGNVCMDMTMVEVTDIDCKEGDEVIIFDSQTTVEDLASRTHTISYEILTGIGRRVPRMWHQTGEIL